MEAKKILRYVTCLFAVVILFSSLVGCDCTMSDDNIYSKYSVFSDQPVEQILSEVVKSDTVYTEGSTLYKLTDLQEFRKILTHGKVMSDLDVAKEILKAINYEEELINQMSEGAILDALNYSTCYIEEIRIPIENCLDNQHNDDAIAASVTESSSDEKNGITITISMSIDPYNRRIKHAAWFDCSGNNLVVSSDQSQAILVKKRGKQYIALANINSKFAAINYEDGMAFAVMSYDYHDKKTNVFQSSQNYDYTGRNYVYNDILKHSALNYCAFGFDLPNDNSNGNSLLVNWFYECTNFRFYMQYYTIYNIEDISSANISVSTSAYYYKPSTNLNGGFSLSLEPGSIGMAIDITPSNGYNEIANANLTTYVDRSELAGGGV